LKDESFTILPRNIFDSKPDATAWRADQLLHGQLHFGHLLLPAI